MKTDVGLSVIVCSVNQEYALALKKNIENTSGIKCEFLIFDNTKDKLPIAQVYNKEAALSKYPYLLFIHEDVRWLSANWGDIIINKLEEKSTGVIGFTGSKIKYSYPTPFSWSMHWNHAISNYVQKGEGNKHTNFESPYFLCRTQHSEKTDFTPTIAVDGMAFFVRRDLWEKYPFDEEALKGFHCYDIDFSLTIHHNGFKNYVCTDKNVLITHFSLGSFKKEWFNTVADLHESKWKNMLPTVAGDAILDPDEEAFVFQFCAYHMFKNAIKEKSISKKDLKRMGEIMCRDHQIILKNRIKLFYKYFWYRFLK